MPLRREHPQDFIDHLRWRRRVIDAVGAEDEIEAAIRKRQPLAAACYHRQIRGVSVYALVMLGQRIDAGSLAIQIVQYRADPATYIEDVAAGSCADNLQDLVE